MNVRKPTDHSAMFKALDGLMVTSLPQMEPCCEIGHLVSARLEKGVAVSAVQTGDPVYPPARRKLAEHGISCAGKTARQLINADYSRYDLRIGMDRANLQDMQQRPRR